MDPDLERELRAAEEIVLVTSGRKTGRAHETTVWCAYEDGAVWLRTDHGSDWYRNLRRDPRCHIRLGATVLAAVSETIADEAAALRRVVDLFRVKYGAEWVSDWFVERGRAPVRLRLER
ncbi:MAG TPA: nitroreductase/quinone reductase family protein [Candidatus Limnocylindria bacterium]|nr:nitroreductase/quinone reductase family protein [Candidatus Limnocylindria bacterium]